MKLTTFLVLITTLMVSASVYSQNTKLNLKFESIPFGELFREIEKQTEFRFAFSDSKLDSNQKIKLEAKDETLESILDKVLPEGTTYDIIDKYVVILDAKKKSSLIEIQQQQRSVTGKITDSNGQPLPGVTVIVKGTTQGTVSNFDGEYVMTNIPQDATLVFSFVGMQTQEIVAGNQQKIDIQMIESTIGLDEVVAVGYGTQKRVNLTGAVGLVNEEEITNRPVAKVSEIIQGAVPGLNIEYARGGDPDAKLNWQIRGQGSPYILVDGIPMDVNNVNPNDIESISVLKDASSAAIYGGSAAYGVVLITTKSGALGADETHITYSNNISFATPTTLPEVMNSLDYATWWNTVTANSGTAPMFSDEVISRIKAYIENPDTAPSTYPDKDNPNRWGRMSQANANTNWFDVYFKDWEVHQQHNISVRGGTKKSGYFVSGGLYKNRGQMAFGDDQYDRYTVSGAFDYDITDWLKVGFRPKYVRALTDWPHDGYGGDGLGRNVLFHDLPRRWITDPVKTPDGQWGEMSRIAIYESGARDKNQDENAYITFDAEIKPTKDWNIIGSYTFNRRSYERLNHQPIVYLNDINGNPFVVYDLVPPNQVHKEFNHDTFEKYDIYSTYEKKLQDHLIKVMVGHNRQSSRNNYMYSKRQYLITDEVPSLSTATGRMITGDNIALVATMGYFSRINYNYKEKYLLEVNARYDGSYKYRPSDRWGFFPSFSMGYRISEENFFDPLKTYIPLLTFRASYGQLGDQAGMAYTYLSTMNIASEISYIMGDERPSTVYMPPILSEDLTWETLTTLNLGIDAIFFDNRLFTYFDWFKKERSDIITAGKPLPSLLGTSAPSINSDTWETKGWELRLNWRDRINSDFSYNVDINISDYKTVVTKTDNPDGFLNRNYVGKTIGEIWGFKSDGLFQSEDEINSAPSQSAIYGAWFPGDVRYSDLNDDKKIDFGNGTLDDPGDRTIIGNSSPRYIYSLRTELNWKKLNFSMLWSGIGQRDRWFTNYTFWGVGDEWHHAAFKEHQDYWTPDNRGAYFPRPAYQRNHNRQVSDRYLQNTAFLRLKNVQLGYTLDQRQLKNILKSATIYLSAENFITFSNLFDYFDPEVLSGYWGEGKVHPLSKQISIGLNVTL